MLRRWPLNGCRSCRRPVTFVNESFIGSDYQFRDNFSFLAMLPVTAGSAVRHFYVRSNVLQRQSHHRHAGETPSTSEHRDTGNTSMKPHGYREHTRSEVDRPESAYHARNILFRRAYKAEEELSQSIDFTSLKKRVMRATVSYNVRDVAQNESAATNQQTLSINKNPTNNNGSPVSLPPYMIEIKIDLGYQLSSPTQTASKTDVACRVVTNSSLVASWLLDEFRSHASPLIWEGVLKQKKKDEQKDKKTSIIIKSYLHIHVNAEPKFLEEQRHHQHAKKDDIKSKVLENTAISVWKFVPNICENLNLQHAAAAEQLHRRDSLIQSKDGGFLAVAAAKFSEHRSRSDARTREVHKQLRALYNKHHRNGQTKEGAQGGDDGSKSPFSQRTLEELKEYLAASNRPRDRSSNYSSSVNDDTGGFGEFARFAYRLDSLKASEAEWATMDQNSTAASEYGYVSSANEFKELHGDVDTEVSPMNYNMHGPNRQSLNTSYTNSSLGHNSHMHASVAAAHAEKRAEKLEQEQFLATRCGGISIGLRGALHSMLGDKMGTANAVTSPSSPAKQLVKPIDVDKVIGFNNHNNKSILSSASTSRSTAALIDSVVPSMTFSMTHGKSTSDPTTSLLSGRHGKVFWATVPLKNGGFASSWTQPKGATGSALFRNERNLADLYTRAKSDDPASGVVSNRYYLGAHGAKVRERDQKPFGSDSDELSASSTSSLASAELDSLRYLQLSPNRQSPAVSFVSAKRDECVMIIDVDPISNIDTVPLAAISRNENRDVYNVDGQASKTMRKGCDVSYLTALVSLTSGRSSFLEGVGTEMTSHSENQGDGIYNSNNRRFSPLSPYDEGYVGGANNTTREAKRSWSPASHDHFRRLQQDVLRQLEAVLVASIVPAADAAWCSGSGIVFSSTDANDKTSQKNGETALLFAGPPGCGKTTMALHCLSAAAAAAGANPSEGSSNDSTSNVSYSVKLLSCDSLCILPAPAELPSSNTNSPPLLSKLAVVGLPMNPTLGLGSLMGTLLPNHMLDPVLLATQRLIGLQYNSRPLLKAMQDAAVIQEESNRALAQQIAVHGETALWTWDKKFGTFATLTSSNSSDLKTSIRKIIADEERLDALITESKGTLSFSAPSKVTDGEFHFSSFNSLNIDLLYRKAFKDYLPSSEKTGASQSSWQCYAGTLRFVIVLNWSQLSSATSTSDKGSWTYIRKLTDPKDVERVLGPDLIRAQLATAENAATRGKKLDSTDDLAEAEANFLLAGGAQADDSSMRSGLGEMGAAPLSAVGSANSMSSALLSSNSVSAVSIPLTQRQMLEKLVTDADTKAKQNQKEVETAQQERLAEEAEKQEKIKLARLTISLDAQTRFVAFSGRSPSGELSSASVGDGTRDVGLVKRHLFLDESAVPPLIFDASSGENRNVFSASSRVPLSLNCLPEMVASTIAGLADTEPDNTEKANHLEQDDVRIREQQPHQQAVPYAGIEVYEVTGAVNMKAVRDFALNLGKKCH